MKVILVIGAYTILAHYRYLESNGAGRMDYDVLGVVRRAPDGSRVQLDDDEAAAVAIRYESAIDDALFSHAEAPDEFNAWLYNHPINVLANGTVAYEECIKLTRAAFQAAHKYEGTGA